MSYHVDRFHSAVMVLAGDGHVKQRLLKAYEENLLSITESDLPGDLKRDFSELKNRMSRVQPTMDEGPACATVRKMSSQEASRCAISVVSMYGEMLRRLGDDDHRDEGIRKEQVPPFLVKTAS